MTLADPENRPDTLDAIRRITPPPQQKPAAAPAAAANAAPAPAAAAKRQKLPTVIVVPDDSPVRVNKGTTCNKNAKVDIAVQATLSAAHASLQAANAALQQVQKAVQMASNAVAVANAALSDKSVDQGNSVVIPKAVANARAAARNAANAFAAANNGALPRNSPLFKSRDRTPILAQPRNDQRAWMQRLAEKAVEHCKTHARINELKESIFLANLDKDLEPRLKEIREENKMRRPLSETTKAFLYVLYTHKECYRHVRQAFLLVTQRSMNFWTENAGLQQIRGHFKNVERKGGNGKM